MKKEARLSFLQNNLRMSERMSICSVCRCDLVVQKEPARKEPGRSGQDSDGFVYCANPECIHNGIPHPTKDRVNS